MMKLIFGLCVAILPATAQAARLSIIPSYVQSFDSAFAPLGALADDGAATPAGGYLQIEFRLTLEDAAPGEDFWVAMFNITLGPGLQNDSGWFDPATAQANGLYPADLSLAQFNSTGAVGGVRLHWQFDNGDFGTDFNDLQSIIVEAAPAEATNRQYGEPLRPGAGTADALGYPTLIGTLLVERTESIESWISVSPIAGSPWGLYVDNSGGDGEPVAQPASSFAGGILMIPVPEPTTWTLAILGGMLLLSRRRRASRRKRHAGRP